MNNLNVVYMISHSDRHTLDRNKVRYVYLNCKFCLHEITSELARPTLNQKFFNFKNRFSDRSKRLKGRIGSTDPKNTLWVGLNWADPNAGVDANMCI